MIDLYGTYIHNVDAKGRLQLPANFRPQLDKNLLIIVEPKKQSLYVFDEESFDVWCNKFFEDAGGFNQRNAAMINARSVLRGSARPVETDEKGRIILSADQREVVGIEHEVAIVGNSGYFEIWDSKRREEAVSQVDLAALLFD